MKHILYFLLLFPLSLMGQPIIVMGERDTVYYSGSLPGVIDLDKVYVETPSNPSAAPSGLSLTTVSDVRIDLAWTDNSDNETGFKIERSTNGTDYTVIDTADANAEAYSNTGLTEGTRYYYKVAAYVGDVDSLSNADDDYTARKWVLTSTGTGAGVSTIALQFATTNIVATLDGNGKFYSDAGGTADESASFTFTAGSLITRYIKVTSGTSNLLIFSKGNQTGIGNTTTTGWVTATNSPTASLSITIPTLLNLRISGTCTLTGLPTGLTYFYLYGSGINWTYSGALPTGLNFVTLFGNSINWTYSGALPTELTNLFLGGTNINWTYSGALPTKLTYLSMNGANINWTYSGALPTGLTYLLLSGANINWTYSGALPTKLTYLSMNGASINWTGLDVGNDGNITTFSLSNYRTNKMSSVDMIILLTQMKNRTGTLPATVTINDYADYASPPSGVTDAVNALKTAKSITTVTLGE